GGDNSESVVRHDVLPAESGADVRVAAGIFLQHEQGWVVRTSVRQLDFGMAAGERDAAESCAEDELSVGRRCEVDGVAFGAGGLRDELAHSRLGKKREGRGERKSGRRCKAGRIFVDQAAMVAGG